MPARKRAAPAATGERRRSGRISSTPKKSSYFEDDDDDDDEYEAEPPPRKRGRVSKGSAKKEVPADESDDYKDEEGGDDDVEEADGEVDEDAPMKVTILPLEQMRGTGGVDYEDERVHKNTMLFLKDLKANNKRSWLKCEPCIGAHARFTDHR